MGKKTKIVLLVVTTLIVVVLFVLRNMAFKQANGEAKLAWNANTEEDLSGYKIYYGAEPRKGDCPKDGGYAKSIDAGNVTTYKLGNLEPGKTYYFSVTSSNKSGKESCFSPEMKKTIALNAEGKIGRIAKWLHLQ